jgi:RNA polymerase sigma-32 factor
VAAQKKTPVKKPKSAGKAGVAEKKARAERGEDDDESGAEPLEAGEREADDGEHDHDDDGRGADGESEGDGDGGDEDGEVVDAAAELVDEEEITDDELVGRAGGNKRLPADDSVALSRSDPLQAYLREVQRHSLLTPEEEKSLAVRYAETQDVVAARRLVTANLRLVVKIAYEYRRAYKNIMDLIQEGNIGLMQAVKKYDPHRGVKLSSYSAWWIRAYILRFIINNWRLVKLGTTQAQRKLFFNLNKEKAKLAALGIDPTSAEIAKRLGVEENEAMEMDRRLSSSEASLDAPVGDNEGRAVARIELLPSGMQGPDTMVADEQVQHILREKLAEFRKTLKGKDIDIFDRRLVAEDPLTLQELGDQFGVSRERVRQIEARLTMNLRNYLKEALGDAMTS